MTASARLILALVIFLADFVIFVIPLSALFAAYIILARPPWFKDWVLKLYERNEAA